MYENLLEMVKFIIKGGYTDNLADILTINPATNAAYADLWTAMMDIKSAIVVPIAMFLIMLYFTMDIVEATTLGVNTPQKLLTTVIKLMIAVFFVNNAISLFLKLWNIGTAAISAIEVTTGISDDAVLTEKAVSVLDNMIGRDGKSAEEVLGGWGWFEGLGYQIRLIIPYIITAFGQIFIIGLTYSRLIQLILRITFAPIGMADMYTNGIHGNSGKYLKSFFAIALQGVFIVAISIIVGYLSVSIMSSGGGVKGGTVVAILGVGMVMKSQSLAKEVVGA